MDLVVEKEKGRVLKLDSLSRTEHWKGVDILIFNSYHWWIHTGRSQTYVRVAFFFFLYFLFLVYTRVSLIMQVGLLPSWRQNNEGNGSYGGIQDSIDYLGTMGGFQR